jgi:hypothetical protein
MATPPPRPLLQQLLDGGFSFYRIVEGNRWFVLLIVGSLAAAWVTHPYPGVAMWVGFLLAGYATIANDSIQTIGTFLASNRERAWWQLWIFIGGIFLATVTWSWLNYGGDVSYERLTAKGFAEAPTSFSFIQIAAPAFLLVLTRLRMPVSTTFLILSCFALDRDGITEMLLKSVSGYGVAFVVGFLVWIVGSRAMDRTFRGTPGTLWLPLQWLSTGVLWATWVMQDAANIAVYLPRQLPVGAFAAFAGFIFAGLGVLFLLRGDRIQQVVEEKTDVIDVRHATVIDFFYAILLFAFKEISVVPMSTTWVFIGLLAGREFGMGLARHGASGLDRRTARLMGKDLLYAGIGLAVSLLLAVAANPALFFGP